MRESIATFAALATVFLSLFFLSHADPRSRLSLRPGSFAGAPAQQSTVAAPNRCPPPRGAMP